MNLAGAYPIANILASDSRNGLTIAITISIIPSNVNVIAGYKLHVNGLYNPKVMLDKNSIRIEKIPVAINAPAVM